MFSFHKPKVYRSSTGCCICKAKSSSSRFTDSKKYEEDFMKCFQLEERRTGEICNACVLLVKRWKKLPPGSNRNWRHVVDARAGPGIKSLTKFKAKNKKNKAKEVKEEKFEKILKKKHAYSKNDRDRENSPMSDDLTEEYLPGTGSKGSSRANSPAGSDDIGEGENRLEIAREPEIISNFIPRVYFKRKNVCCGILFIGRLGELVVVPTRVKPCLNCLSRQQSHRQATIASTSPSHSLASASPCHSSASTSPAHSVDSGNESSSVASSSSSTISISKAKRFCDSSSDSGCDDSSQGMVIGSKKLREMPGAQALPLLVAPQNLINRVQIQSSVKVPSPMSTTVQLKANAVGAKMPIKLLCKPVTIVNSAKLSLSNNNAVPVDFSARGQAQRQPFAN